MENILTHETKELILSLIRNKNIVCSWGIHNIIITSSAISFDVDGFKYKGQVEIKSNKSSYYSIYMNNQLACNCDIEHIVSQLDLMIETSESYCHDITVWVETKKRR